ncbi:hypothetical protein AB6D03_23620, partial [Vibrio splendidus]
LSNISNEPVKRPFSISEIGADRKLNSFSKEFGTSIPETRGIAMDLCTRIMEMFHSAKGVEER